MEYFSLIQNGRSKMAVIPDPSLTVNDVIMTSLLLLKFINVFANFYLSIFRFEGKNWWKLDFASVKLHHFVNQVMPGCWK